MCSLSLDVLYDRAIGPFSFIGASFDVCSGAHFPTGSYSYGGSVTFRCDLLTCWGTAPTVVPVSSSPLRAFRGDARHQRDQPFGHRGMSENRKMV